MGRATSASPTTVDQAAVNEATQLGAKWRGKRVDLDDGEPMDIYQLFAEVTGRDYNHRSPDDVGDLVQLDHEYTVIGNPSLFRIRSINGNTATLGQLDEDTDDYRGIDTTIDLDNPDLVQPYPEVLAMYPRHTNCTD